MARWLESEVSIFSHIIPEEMSGLPVGQHVGGERLIAGGLKVSLTTTLYGLVIYILSLMLRAVNAWRHA